MDGLLDEWIIGIDVGLSVSDKKRKASPRPQSSDGAYGELYIQYADIYV